eukprot:g12525.t1
MNDSRPETSPRDPRVQAALEEYLESIDRGETVPKQQFLKRHADVAGELSAFIATEEQLRQLVASGDASGEAIGEHTAETRSNVEHDAETVPPRRAAGSVSNTSGRTELPSRFGRYRILKPLGSGAMGVVYLAEDTQLERQLALKTPAFENDESGELLERFYREARSAATLQHPHICPVYDVGEIDGRHYIAMAYIEGRPLSAFIRPDKRLPERKTLLLVRKLAMALIAAHAKGIIHRDLKPSNVMVDTRGEPVIMDFGLAHDAHRTDASRLTHSGMLIGSPAYMSPEQVEGVSATITSASDQYSLGVILFELLTGRLPFSGSVTGVIAQILTREPPNLSELRKEAVLIGRGEMCAVRLSDPSASRVHCRVTATNGRVYLEDIGSRWGTLVNGTPTEAREIKPGDRITIGDSELELQSHDCSAVTMPPARKRVVVSADNRIDGSENDFKGDRPKAAKPPKFSPDSFVGTRFKRYDIESIVARSRSGVVLRSIESATGRVVALKVFRPEFFRDEFAVQRFLRAVKAAVSFQHENLILLHTAGRHAALCYTASELIEGQSVAQIIEQVGIAGMLDWRNAWRVAVGVARGLRFIHNHNIIHRNLSPANVLVRTSDGTVKLGGFMLARALELDVADRLTLPGEIVGDVRYLSPEQVSGVSEIDQRADLYSLGAMLYAILTGRPPFVGSPSAVIGAILVDEPAPPTKFHLAIPAMLEGIVLRLLAKQPQSRYADAGPALAAADPGRTERMRQLRDWFRPTIPSSAGPRREMRSALTTVKVLSSGTTKGQVDARDTDGGIVDAGRIGDPPRFWEGYEIRFLGPGGQAVQTARVESFDPESGRLRLSDTAIAAVDPGTRYELHSGEEAPILAIRTVLGLPIHEPIPPISVKLGTTRGTNALLERKGARTAFITTRGFADVLLIGNQDRPRLFDLAIEKPSPLFESVIEIDERLDRDGNVLLAPDEDRVREQLTVLKATGVVSVGICLMHSFTNPAHERLVEGIAREVGFEEVSTSSRLSPLIKIVSRGDTTVMDAYLNPILREYVGTIRGSLGGKSGEPKAESGLDVVSRVVDSLSLPTSQHREDWAAFSTELAQKLEESELTARQVFGARLAFEELAIELLQSPVAGQHIGDHQYICCQLLERLKKVRDFEHIIVDTALGSPLSALKLMTSAGGLVDADRFVGKDSILSGPAGGVIGFSRVAQRAGFAKSIGFDMGGTSTDVARFDGQYEREFETVKAGVRVVAPMLAIETVAAGGGSICGFDGVKLHVGPESAGADPGPACYGRGGPLTVTDLNLYLGKIIPARFPFPLDRAAVEDRLNRLCDEIADSPMGKRYAPAELAEGFLQIANESMVRPIRKISVARGYDPADYALVTFGGAGAQHACAVASSLGINKVLVHPYAGILSAYGIGLADVRRFGEESVLKTYSPELLEELEPQFQHLESRIVEEVRAENIPPERTQPPVRGLDMRYSGVESAIHVVRPDDGDYATEYERLHQQLYGYTHSGRTIEVTAMRVEVVGTMTEPAEPETELVARTPEPAETTTARFEGESLATGVYLREQLHPGDEIAGPAIVCEATSTVVIDPGWNATVQSRGEIVLKQSRPVSGSAAATRPGSVVEEGAEADPVLLEIFNNLFASIAEQMGLTLQRTSFSTNVKERLDFSCAIFSPDGELVVNAPHIPVHLGAMSETVKRILEDNPNISPGDVFVTNDPYRGGSHLPDVTVVTPVFDDADDASRADILFFTASRAHHSEIGGIVPGSMPPFSRNLAEEGVLIRNFKLVDRGISREADLRELLLSGLYPTRSVDENLRDVAAQTAANNVGVRQLNDLIDRYSLPVVQAYMRYIQQAAAEKMRLALAAIPDGEYVGVDHLDDGQKICVKIGIRDNRATVDFTGTDPVMFPEGGGGQPAGSANGTESPAGLQRRRAYNLNANRAIVTAAVLYVFRCLIKADIPLNGGVLEPVEIVLPECLLNPAAHDDPAECPAVVGGNVETSQRVVDVLLGALEVAAASQGTMNNLTFGDDTSQAELVRIAVATALFVASSFCDR